MLDLLDEIIIRRTYVNAYYVVMPAIALLAYWVARRSGFLRMSGYLWVISGAICLAWEVTLYLLGMRHYNPGWWSVGELLFHALLEAGPGLILMLIVGHRAGIISLEDVRDDDTHDNGDAPD